MLKYNFKRISLFFAVLILLACLLSFSSYAEDNGYTIENYAVTMKVNETNVLDMTEQIHVDFSLSSHGIYREIPVVLTPRWEDDGKVVSKRYKVSLKNISVTDGATGQPIPWESAREGGSLRLKIGDSDITITGEKTYVIRYSYSIGNDGIKDYDQLYYNLLGTGWDVPIQKSSFSIQMPKEFDASLLGFTMGYEGSTETSSVEYEISGNTISGQVTRILNPGEALTVRLKLQEGYFSQVPVDYGMGIIVFSFLLAICSVILFWLLGRDDKVYIPVEVTTPNDIPSAEAGLIVDGYADTRDLVSLIIYWADKGYLAISSDNKNHFTLIKQREADSQMDAYQRTMFEELFRGRDQVTAADLKYKFSATLQRVKLDLLRLYRSPEKKLYTSSSVLAKTLCYLFAGLCTGILFFRVFSDYLFDPAAGLVGGAIALVATIGLCFVVGYAVDKSAVGSKAAVFVASLFHLGLLFLAFLIAIVISGLIYAAAAAAICAAICGISGSFAKKRTPQSSEKLGRLLGLKRFIEMAEKPRLEMLVNENPSLFYNILPYAYVFNITDKWAKQFESIAIEPPSWYYTTPGTPFHPVLFTTMMYRNMNAYQNSMIAPPPNKTSGSGFGGGGFTGGGFSGGGFGGGGGGRW